MEEGWGGARGEGVEGAALTLPSPAPHHSHSGSEVRVLLFNSTGDRDSAALLKLLQVRGWLGDGQQATQPWFWL